MRTADEGEASLPMCPPGIGHAVAAAFDIAPLRSEISTSCGMKAHGDLFCTI